MAKKSVYMAVLAAVTALCSACGGGAVSAEGEAELPAGEKYVALTFDDGPRRPEGAGRQGHLFPHRGADRG